MIEQKTTFTEQLADEGAYLTQRAEVPDDERLYLTRRVKLSGEAAGLWRDASAGEKAHYDARMAERYPAPLEPMPEEAQEPEAAEPELSPAGAGGLQQGVRA